MQKTKIEYYCDKCGEKITNVMFWYEFRSRFYSEKFGHFVETVARFDDVKHYCLKCAEPIIDVLGLEMNRTAALLDVEGNIKNLMEGKDA